MHKRSGSKNAEKLRKHASLPSHDQKVRKIGPFWSLWVVQDLIINRCFILRDKGQALFPAKYGRFFSIFGKKNFGTPTSYQSIRITTYEKLKGLVENILFSENVLQEINQQLIFGKFNQIVICTDLAQKLSNCNKLILNDFS